MNIFPAENVGRIESNGKRRRVQLLIHTTLTDGESLSFLVKELLIVTGRKTFEIECMDEDDRLKESALMKNETIRVVPYEP